MIALRHGIALLLTLLPGLAGAAGDHPNRGLEVRYLRCLMGPELIPYANLEVPGQEHVAICGGETNRHLGFRLLPRQRKLNGGVRAEVGIDYPFKAGDTVRYAWRFMVPAGFQSDAPQNRWWIMGQWHDQPDRTRQETWDGFPSRSPPVLLGLGEQNGQMGFSFHYGPRQEQRHGPFALEPGRWHQLVLVIRWSRQADGQATLYLDDPARPVARAHGPNMHNSFQHYLKLGMYRHPDIQTENWLYVDDVTITTLPP